MLAMNYRGPYRVRVQQKAEPSIEHPNDAIVRVTRACICGSDLHLYHGLVPDTRIGSTFGHEFTGIVEEIGPSVQNLKVGDRASCTAIATTRTRKRPRSAASTVIRTPPAVTTAARPNTCGCRWPMSGRP